MIELNNISKFYNEGKPNEVQALTDVNLHIEDGSSLAIMGVSGSGKTTLLNILGGLDVPTKGKYILNGIDVGKMNDFELSKLRNEKIGFIIQNNALLENEKVSENVKIPLYFSKKYAIREFKHRIDEVLDSVGILDLKKKKVRELSGGQKQRVAIARAIVNNPNIILADEPTSALDSTTAKEIIGLFRMLEMQGRTVIMVTHDINMAKKMDRIVRIVDGKIVE